MYSAFALTLAAVATGAGADQRQSTSDFTVRLMKAPGGVALLVVIGAAIAVTGIVYGIRGIKKSFLKYLRTLPGRRPAPR